jgi:hypothetical protein
MTHFSAVDVSAEVINFSDYFAARMQRKVKNIGNSKMENSCPLVHPPVLRVSCTEFVVKFKEMDWITCFVGNELV